jgi:hypothetical protein
MSTRLMPKGKKTTKPAIQAPRTDAEWQRLMTTTIERAVAVKSRLLPGLRDAQAKGKAENFLRKLGIIHQNDINRLFPV